MKTKTFDCVEMKRRAALLIHQEIEGLTEEQQVKYWERRAEELVQYRRRLATQRGSQTKE